MEEEKIYCCRITLFPWRLRLFFPFVLYQKCEQYCVSVSWSIVLVLKICLALWRCCVLWLFVCVILWLCCVPHLQINRDSKIGKMPKEQATQQTVEILTALKKLGDKLTPDEEAFLQANSSSSLKEFEKVSGDLGKYTHLLISLIISLCMHVSCLCHSAFVVHSTSFFPSPLQM